MRRLAATAWLAAVLAGCGSLGVEELPPPAGPDRSSPVPALGGALTADVDGRARALELYDATTRRLVGRAPAGVGPTHVACQQCGAWCWVVDTRGDALLVFKVRRGADPELTRRLYLPGGPDAISVDRRRGRLRVRLAAGGTVELPAHGRPYVIRRTA
jgi:hypothetical protein